MLPAARVGSAHSDGASPGPRRTLRGRAGPPRDRGYGVGNFAEIFGKISAKCCAFSAVSAPIFARKYAFCSIFQALPDSQAEIFEI